MKARIVVLSGAGMSAESGLKTFRDNGGLWENHRVEDVATPGAWETNPDLVLTFYNERRKALLEASPNAGHMALARLQRNFHVSIVTQNIDDLHERAGSKDVLHLHGELLKARSSINPDLIYPVNGREIRIGELCELGSQLRPHVVWFGEPVTALPAAAEVVASADILVVVGTSLSVYPAAALAWQAPDSALRVLIDPNPPEAPGFHVIRAKASKGLLDFEKSCAI
jgi:NAD-dependent deacetylase